MSMITEEFGVIPPDIQTQMLIAPVMGEMIATQAFAIGEQFIVNSTLYKATKAIAIGDTISVGTGANDNCILSDTISQQIKGIPINVGNRVDSVTIDETSAGHLRLMINNPASFTEKHVTQVTFYASGSGIRISLSDGTYINFLPSSTS